MFGSGIYPWAPMSFLLGLLCFLERDYPHPKKKELHRRVWVRLQGGELWARTVGALGLISV